jgi:hypothetical protein
MKRVFELYETVKAWWRVRSAIRRSATRAAAVARRIALNGCRL